jgi:hypothetical protein
VAEDDDNVMFDAFLFVFIKFKRNSNTEKSLLLKKRKNSRRKRRR